MEKFKPFKLLAVIFILSFLYINLTVESTFAAEAFRALARTDTSISFHYITNKPDYRKILILRRQGDKPVAPKTDLDYNYGTNNYSLNISAPLGENNFGFYEFSKEKEVDLNLDGLAPTERYAIDIYTAKTKNTDKKSVAEFDRETYNFATLAREPKRQAANIGFSKATENEITVSWSAGNGSSCVVFVKQGSAPEKPQDGKAYAASTKYGDEKARVDNSGAYCIYNGKSKGAAPVTVKNLPAGKYYFAVYESNGNDETTNYNIETEKQNPRAKSTALAAPVITQSEFGNGSLKLAWKPVGNIKYYSIDIAADPGFNKIVDGLSNVDVGNVTEFEFTEFPATAESTIYVRVKAVGEDASSTYSAARSVNK